MEEQVIRALLDRIQLNEWHWSNGAWVGTAEGLEIKLTAMGGTVLQGLSTKFKSGSLQARILEHWHQEIDGLSSCVSLAINRNTIEGNGIHLSIGPLLRRRGMDLTEEQHEAVLARLVTTTPLALVQGQLVAELGAVTLEFTAQAVKLSAEGTITTIVYTQGSGPSHLFNQLRQRYFEALAEKLTDAGSRKER